MCDFVSVWAHLGAGAAVRGVWEWVQQERSVLRLAGRYVIQHAFRPPAVGHDERAGTA